MNRNRKLSRKTYGPRQTQLSPQIAPKGQQPKCKYDHSKRPVGIFERLLWNNANS